MAKKKTWKHKRYGKGFIGSFSYDNKHGERVFVLSKIGAKNKYQYGSIQQAKKAGWIYG